MTSDMPPVISKSQRWRPIAELTGRFFDLPISRVLAQHTPTAEPVLLEHLASELDLLETEAWKRAQTDAERRYLIDHAHERKRTVGTDAGMIQAVTEAGGELRKIWAQPNKLFLSAAASPAERNAWLSQHPELRLYPRRVPGLKEGAFTTGEFLGVCFPSVSTALTRSRLRATLVKQGIETELETTSWQLASAEKEVVTEVVIPSKRGFASFLGQPMSFAASTDASLRRIVLRDIALYTESTAQLGLRTITPGLKPLDADGEMIAEVRPAPASASFLGRCPRFLVRLDAELAQYRRIRLFDPNVPAARTRAASHLGYSRLTIPPRCAEMQIAFFGRKHPKLRFLGQPCASAGDREPLARLLANMRLAKRFSDSILVDTRIFRPVRAGYVVAGTVLAGGVTQK